MIFLEKMMKKIIVFSAVMIAILGISQFSTIRNSIRLYSKIYTGEHLSYVDCSFVLTKAVSKTGYYRDVSQYMRQEIYNSLSIKTKSYYRENQEWDEKIYIVAQKKDLSDDRVVYVDFILYDNQDRFIKYVRFGRLRIMSDGGKWQVLDYIQSDKPVNDEYIGNVYWFILPK